MNEHRKDRGRAGSSQATEVPEVIAIGASTGGPAVLRTILTALPTEFRGSIVIVQHLDPRFVVGFVEWLQECTGRTITLAHAGAPLRHGHIFFARGGQNIGISHTGSFVCPPCDQNQLYCPDVDNFFRSLCEYPRRGLAIVLTGMGDDGACGLAALARAGWRTIVQRPESCVVAGMPRAAIARHPNHSELSPDEICTAIKAYSADFTWRPTV